MLSRPLAAFAAVALTAPCSQDTKTNAVSTPPAQTTSATGGADTTTMTPTQQALRRDADRIRDEQVGPNARVLEERVFFGDFNGDGAEDAVAHYFIDGRPAAATLVPGPVAMVMVNKDGHLEFVRAETVAGDNPRDPQFSDGAVTITTDQNGAAAQTRIATR
jgi:hypothetical protein